MATSFSARQPSPSVPWGKNKSSMQPVIEDSVFMSKPFGPNKNWTWTGCAKCKTKDTNLFCKNSHTRSGLQHYCKHCHRSMENKERKRAENLRRMYHLSPEKYNAILKHQNGVCALCGQPPTNRRLVVDHDHKCCTGRNSCGKCVRGLLHYGCNILLGHIENNPSLPKQAIEYLKQKHTEILW